MTLFAKTFTAVGFVLILATPVLAELPPTPPSEGSTMSFSEPPPPPPEEFGKKKVSELLPPEYVEYERELENPETIRHESAPAESLEATETGEPLPPEYVDYEREHTSTGDSELTELGSEFLRADATDVELVRQQETVADILTESVGRKKRSKIRYILQELSAQKRQSVETAEARMEKFDSLQEQLSELSETGALVPEREEVQKIYAELQTLKTELASLHIEIAQIENEEKQVSVKDAKPTAGIDTPPASFEDYDDTESTTDAEPAEPEEESGEMLEELGDINDELAYREELIGRLLAALESEQTTSSPLVASLAAITKYPAASGAMVIFALVLFWLFRGRIAELSGFGVSVKFDSGDKQASGHDHCRHRSNDQEPHYRKDDLHTED